MVWQHQKQRKQSTCGPKPCSYACLCILGWGPRRIQHDSTGRNGTALSPFVSFHLPRTHPTRARGLALFCPPLESPACRLYNGFRPARPGIDRMQIPNEGRSIDSLVGWGVVVFVDSRRTQSIIDHHTTTTITPPPAYRHGHSSLRPAPSASSSENFPKPAPKEAMSEVCVCGGFWTWDLGLARR